MGIASYYPRIHLDLCADMNTTKRRRALLLYLGARAHSFMGRKQSAARRYRASLELCDHPDARKYLSRIEFRGEEYFAVLRRIHAFLKPRNYVEIGVFKGKSLRLASPATLTVGIDPDPQLTEPPSANTRIFPETSDDFFAHRSLCGELGGHPVELALIDGMHKFEFALRDFINLERAAAPDSIILVHDCYPIDARSAARERQTVFWTGDVWRLIVLLKKYRADLHINTIATAPSGLAVITHLDPQSCVLAENLPSIVADGMSMEYASIEGDRAQNLNSFPNDWARISELLASRPRGGRAQ